SDAIVDTPHGRAVIVPDRPGTGGSPASRIRSQRHPAEAPVVQVVGPTDQWVLERLARRLASKLPYAQFVPWKPRSDAPPALAYYVNYALYQRPTSFIDVGFFTHRDDDHSFLERARAIDHSVCMSRVYADWLREQGVKTVTHIPMGYDSYLFRPRLVLGVIGR